MEKNKTQFAGKNLTMAVIWGLQEYGEQLMIKKLGSIVAIEPSGEIHSLISSHQYDPHLLVGRERSKIIMHC